MGVVTHARGKWERIPIKIDSGAIDAVMPPTVAKYFDTVQTEMSQKGSGIQSGQRLSDQTLRSEDAGRIW